jgi:hypothetical protein
MKKRIDQLLPGDLVDLEGDKFADNGQHPEFEFELQQVMEIEHETLNCVRVDFEGCCIGFPPEHIVEVPISPENEQGSA